jgi:hypothetical protein
MRESPPRGGQNRTAGGLKSARLRLGLPWPGGTVIQAITRYVLGAVLPGTLLLFMYLPVVLAALILLCGAADVLLGASAGWHLPPPPPGNADPPSQP